MPKASRVTNIRATMTLICLLVFMPLLSSRAGVEGCPLGARRFLATAAGIRHDTERVVLTALRDLAGLDGDVTGGLNGNSHGIHGPRRRSRNQDAPFLGVSG